MTETTKEEQTQKILKTTQRALEKELAEPEVALCIKTVLETTYAATGCELWNSIHSTGCEIPPQGEEFPYGTFVTLIPNPGLKKPDEGHFEGLFTLTRGAKDPRVTAIMSVEGSISTDGSHKVENARYASTELNEEQIVTSISLFGISMANKLL